MAKASDNSASSVRIANPAHHKVLLDAGYVFESTTTTDFTDRSQTTSDYTRKPKGGASKNDMCGPGDNDHVSVTVNSISDEPIWRRSWYDPNGQWQDMTGSASDALAKALKA